MSYVKLIKRYVVNKKNVETSWNLRVKSIDWDPQIKSVIKPFVGANGSSTLRSGIGGRLLNINAIARDNDIRGIHGLMNDDEFVTLVSLSSGEYNGQYYIVNLSTTEKKRGIFDVTIKLQERSIFNARYMNFKTFNIAVRAASLSPLKLGQKWNPG